MINFNALYFQNFLSGNVNFRTEIFFENISSEEKNRKTLIVNFFIHT
jgi:hypothetical protein